LKKPFFLFPQHQVRFQELLGMDNTHVWDVERRALFYLISGNGELYKKRNKIYDFVNHQIRLCLTDEHVDFSSGCRSLIRLGFNLYNGFHDNLTSPSALFHSLDTENSILALYSMALRFAVS